MKLNSYLLSMLLLASCGNPPTADSVQWSVKRQDDASYIVNVKASLRDGEDGSFVFDLETVDERGCHAKHFLRLVPTASSNKGTTFKEIIKTTWRIASATLSIRHHPFTIADDEITPAIFSNGVTVDSAILPPDFPKVPCSSPPLSDDEAIARMPAREVVATAINTAGFLCARVNDMHLSSGNIIAQCTEYRNGRGRAKYRINTADMTVEKM